MTDSPGPHLGGSLWSRELEIWMVPVARAPQDPHQPAECFCLDRKETAGKLDYRAWPVGNRREKAAFWWQDTLRHHKLELEMLLLELQP